MICLGRSDWEIRCWEGTSLSSRVKEVAVHFTKVELLPSHVTSKALMDLETLLCPQGHRVDLGLELSHVLRIDRKRALIQLERRLPSNPSQLHILQRQQICLIRLQRFLQRLSIASLRQKLSARLQLSELPSGSSLTFPLRIARCPATLKPCFRTPVPVERSSAAR